MNDQLPIAETFHSIQGEGHWTGTPMHFIRLTGCPVGKRATQEAGHDIDRFGVLLQGQSLCQTWDGRFFPCDTDFSYHTHMSVDELINTTYESHICLTGGEPLVHQQRLIELGFFQRAFARSITIHIETSGTIALNDKIGIDTRIWITVSPKSGFLNSMMQRADEVKLLVDENFDVDKFTCYPQASAIIYVSPISGEKEVNQDNVKRCMEILKQHPNWRLSAQWHKFLNLR